MIRIITFNPLDEITSAFLNSLQDEGRAATVADTAGNQFDAMAGEQLLASQPVTALAVGAETGISADIDWRDRFIGGWVILSTNGDHRVGKPNDWHLNDVALGPLRVDLAGYLGTGANSNVGTGAVVSAGNPPVNAAGAFPSWAIVAFDGGGTSRVWLYADPTTGSLMAYNATAQLQYLIGCPVASGQTGLR